MERNLHRTGWVLMTILILLMIFTMLRYFTGNTATYFQPEIYIERIVVLRVHILASIAAALAGSLQFATFFRNKYRAAHRTLGKIYIIAVLVGAVAGYMLATTALGGIVTQLGFSIMATLWVGATLMAFQKIRNRDFIGHKRWMIRSFAITFGFVSLRIIFPSLQFGVGLDETTAYQITSWACWMTNVIVIEFMLGRRQTI